MAARRRAVPGERRMAAAARVYERRRLRKIVAQVLAVRIQDYRERPDSRLWRYVLGRYFHGDPRRAAGAGAEFRRAGRLHTEEKQRGEQQLAERLHGRPLARNRSMTQPNSVPRAKAQTTATNRA